MKKHNERNAGRKIEGKTKKISKSISIEQHEIDAVLKDFGTFSGGIKALIKDYVDKKSK